jgi:hypothetical protein
VRKKTEKRMCFDFFESSSKESHGNTDQKVCLRQDDFGSLSGQIQANVIFQRHFQENT